jgi:hypothetical protein
MLSQLFEIGDLLSPSDRSFPADRRASAAPLVVADQFTPHREGVEAGQEIVMMGPGAAVEDHHWWARADSALEELDTVDERHQFAVPSSEFLVPRACVRSS